MYDFFGEIIDTEDVEAGEQIIEDENKDRWWVSKEYPIFRNYSPFNEPPYLVLQGRIKLENSYFLLEGGIKSQDLCQEVRSSYSDTGHSLICIQPTKTSLEKGIFSLDDRKMALRSWLEGISDANMDAIKLIYQMMGAEYSRWLIRCAFTVCTDFATYYAKWVRKRYYTEGHKDLEEGHLHFNLLLVTLFDLLTFSNNLDNLDVSVYYDSDTDETTDELLTDLFAALKVIADTDSEYFLQYHDAYFSDFIIRGMVYDLLNRYPGGFLKTWEAIIHSQL